MQFVKMHGAGNDYLYVNCFAERVDDPVWLARKVSDRHFGIGADGLVLICPSETADARMDIYNADGSRAKMCGNAVRCVGKYAYERGLVSGASMTLAGTAGIDDPHGARWRYCGTARYSRLRRVRNHLRVHGKSALRTVCRRPCNISCGGDRPHI